MCIVLLPTFHYYIYIYIGRVELLFNVTISTFYSKLGSAHGSLTSERLLYWMIEQQQYMYSKRIVIENNNNNNKKKHSLYRHSPVTDLQQQSYNIIIRMVVWRLYANKTLFIYSAYVIQLVVRLRKSAFREDEKIKNKMSYTAVDRA